MAAQSEFIAYLGALQRRSQVQAKYFARQQAQNQQISNTIGSIGGQIAGAVQQNQNIESTKNKYKYLANKYGLYEKYPVDTSGLTPEQAQELWIEKNPVSSPAYFEAVDLEKEGEKKRATDAMQNFYQRESFQEQQAVPTLKVSYQEQWSKKIDEALKSPDIMIDPEKKDAIIQLNDMFNEAYANAQDRKDITDIFAGYGSKLQAIKLKREVLPNKAEDKAMGAFKKALLKKRK